MGADADRRTRSVAGADHGAGAAVRRLRAAQIVVATDRIALFAASDPIAARLATAPGVGPVTARAFVATIDDITRFHSAHEIEACLGVVPSERSSGETRQLGRITNAGNGRMRWLPVEAAWQILRSTSPATAALRAWTLPIARRRGKRIAVVARARRRVGVRYALWRDGVPYDAQQRRPRAKTEDKRAGEQGSTVRESSGPNRERRAREIP
ncbi:MAG: transposase [Gemmatimonadaceae bacterium]|nr:transposase [Gemmatimonadaceae bacterium]